jgi:cephalosporin-C deacetylase-like acetyl esterase
MFLYGQRKIDWATSSRGFMKSASFVVCKNIRMGWFGLLCLVSLAFWGSASRAQEQNRAGKSLPGEAAKAGGESSKQPAEDWTKVTLENSSLVMKRPELAEKDDIPNTGFIRERYDVNWRAEDPFDLYIIRPKGTAKVPAILYLYSFPDDTDQFKNNNWCETAVSGGYAAVGFVGAITGHRMRYRLPKEWFVSEMQEALGSTVHDVVLILDFLATRSDLDLNRVAMFGSGSGGAVAVMASAADSRIRVVDLLGPWGDWPKWVAESKIISEEERPNFVKAEFLEKVTQLEPVKWLPKIKAKALRIQDIRGNKSMPDDSQESLEAASPDFAVINQYGNGRAFLANQLPNSLFDWMKDQLKPDARSQVAVEKNERIHFYPAVQAPAQNWPNVGTLDTTKPATATKAEEGKEKDKP